MPLGVSWRLGRGLAIGATYDLIRGSIDDAITQGVTDPLGNYYLANIRDQLDDLSGRSLTAAVLLDGLPHLKFGASYTTGYDLEMKRTVSLSGVAARHYATFTGSMPAEYKAGVMLDLGRHWRVGADGQFMRFSEFTGRPDWDPIMRDEWTLATGFERAWSAHAHGRGYDRPLRFGFSWRRWAHTIEGAAVDERTASVGTGLPFRNRLGMIDFSLSYAWIGDLAEHGYRSNVWRLGVSITGLEPLIF